MLGNFGRSVGRGFNTATSWGKSAWGWGKSSGRSTWDWSRANAGPIGTALWNAPISRMGIIGAGAGALYGGTVGRDPGQGHLGGAFTGAIGGGILGAGARFGFGMRGTGFLSNEFAYGSATALRESAKASWNNLGPKLSSNAPIGKIRGFAGRMWG